MKRFTMLLIAVLALVACVAAATFISGCSEEKSSNPVSNPSEGTQFEYRINVQHDGNQVAQASVIAIFGNDRDTLLTCSDAGFVSLKTSEPVAVLVGASLGLSGMCQSVEAGDIRIVLDSVVTSPETAAGKVLAAYVFGVYDTDGNGDVRFRYQYNFSYFYCSSGLPGWPYGDPNPNHWYSQNQNDFPAPWKCKKLLVPRRYQYYHQAVYGFSLSRALFLVSTT